MESQTSFLGNVAGPFQAIAPAQGVFQIDAVGEISKETLPEVVRAQAARYKDNLRVGYGVK